MQVTAVFFSGSLCEAKLLRMIGLQVGTAEQILFTPYTLAFMISTTVKVSARARQGILDTGGSFS
jgi:hypothetical protein